MINSLEPAKIRSDGGWLLPVMYANRSFGLYRPSRVSEWSTIGSRGVI